MPNYPILAVCSGKGGVGKSTVAFHLAKLLKDNNYKIGLLDADIYGPSLHLFFEDLGAHQPTSKGDKQNPANIDGLYFMSAAYIAPGGAFIRAPKATAIVKSFFDNVDWGDIDLLVVDFPPGTGDIPLSLLQEVSFQGAIIVTTPHTLSVEDAAKSGIQILQAGVPILGVIENMSYIGLSDSRLYPFGQGGGQELSEILKTPLLSKVPLIVQEGTTLLIDDYMSSLAQIVKPFIENHKGNFNPCSL